MKPLRPTSGSYYQPSPAPYMKLHIPATPNGPRCAILMCEECHFLSPENEYSEHSPTCSHRQGFVKYWTQL